jgi:hypothetical protein
MSRFLVDKLLRREVQDNNNLGIAQIIFIN